MAINCGALPDTLLESELFGHKAGAFTDARTDRPGRFAAARGGTILLDEIGDVSPAMQVRLLRVLQERTYEPLGSVTPVKADVRVIAATNRDLDELVQAGSFREDLYYRVNVVKLIIPPLLERREDIPLLVEHFIAKFNSRQDRSVPGVSEETLARLLAHPYPGNVRELENIIEHAFVLCRNDVIQPKHLPPAPQGPMTSGGGTPRPVGLTIAGMEALLIADTLRIHSGNRTAAAKALGINPSTLHRKIKSLDIETPPTDGRSRKA